jgi:exodeoxyribonuclease VIII
VNAPNDLPLGLHPTMPSERYHRIAAMSAGGLKRMRQSPAHFFGMQLDPDRPEPGEPSPAMKAGTLFHTALFEADQIEARYIVKPEGMSFSSKEGKAWKAALPAGIEAIDADQLSKARTQAKRVRADPDMAALLSEGVPEASAFWVDDHTGELCKCRPDWTSPAGDGVILVDGKSCPDASPDGFGRTAWNMGYLHTAAWYIDGYEAATGLKVYGYVFAAVEHDWPHVAKGWMVPDDLLEKARAENRRLLDLYAECKRTSNWPGYSAGISLITLPAWAQRALENSQ